MAKFRVKATVEAITFDELVEIGRQQNPSSAGMPWSFKYQDRPITHENDNCYLVPCLMGLFRFNRGDMLVTGLTGELFVKSAEDFAEQYEPEVQA